MYFNSITRHGRGMSNISDKQDKKRFHLLPVLITIGVVLIAFVFVLPGLGDYRVAVEYIEALRGQEIAVIVAFTILNVLVYTFPYMAAIPSLRFVPAFILRQTSFMIANALPAGGAIGYGLQYMMLRSYSYSAAQSTSAITVTGVWNMLATVSMPAVAAIVMLIDGQIEREAGLTALVAIVAATFSYGLFYVIIKSETSAERIGSYLDRMVAKYKRRPANNRLRSGLLSFQQQTFTTAQTRWIWLIITNLGQQLGQFSILFVALMFIAPGMTDIPTALAVFAVARLGTFIPLTPSGVGTVDAIMVGMLVQAGVSGDEALAATLIWRMATLLPQMFIGAITFLFWRITTPFSRNDTID